MQGLMLEAENRKLKHALEEKQVMNKQKALLKERKKLEYLRMQLMVEKVKAENEELRGVAKEVLVHFMVFVPYISPASVEIQW